MLPQRYLSIQNSRQANVFIKNLDRTIDNRALFDTFSAIGTVLSCKVAADHHGISRGYGFVQFDCEESAQRAIAQLNGMCMNGKQVYVGMFVPRQERVASPKFTNVYVKNLPESLVAEGLQVLFSPFGTITSAVVMRDLEGKSRGFGFVNFQIPDRAVEAIEKMNGVTHNDKVLFVGRAQKKVDREAELRAKFDIANVYFKNLDDEIVKNEDNLRDLFSQFGTITSCKLMRASNGISKGSGFVAFSTPEESSRALSGLHRKMVGRKPLFLAVAQRKEERKKNLEAKFAQARAPHLLPVFAGGARFGPGTLSYGFPQIFNPQPLGLHRGAYFQQPRQQPLHYNFNVCRGYIPNGRNGPEPSIIRQVPQMPSLSTEARVPESPIAPKGTGLAALASALASANPRMLGERLYPLVEQ